MINPNKEGKFGEFGGRYIAETLMPEVSKLENSTKKLSKIRNFGKNFLTIANIILVDQALYILLKKLQEFCGGAKIF